jgi:hypothetical protein
MAAFMCLREAAGDGLTPAIAAERNILLASGNSTDHSAAYRHFRGREQSGRPGADNQDILVRHNWPCAKRVRSISHASMLDCCMSRGIALQRPVRGAIIAYPNRSFGERAGKT